MPPNGKSFVPEASTLSPLIVFFLNFNFLALAVFDIIGGSKIYIKRPCALRTPPSRKISTCAQVLAYTYITVKSQHRSSINVRLTESSLYNRFCIEWSQKRVLGGFGPLNMICHQRYPKKAHLGVKPRVLSRKCFRSFHICDL